MSTKTKKMVLVASVIYDRTDVENIIGGRVFKDFEELKDAIVPSMCDEEAKTPISKPLYLTEMEYFFDLLNDEEVSTEDVWCFVVDIGQEQEEKEVPTCCVDCGSDNIEADSFITFQKMNYRHVSCAACGNTWVEYFKFSDWEYSDSEVSA